MTSISDFNVKELAEAEGRLQEFEQAAIERARVFLAMNNKPVDSFFNDRGFSVRVNRHDLLWEGESVTFYHTDVQGRGTPQPVYVPREFIFAPPSEKEVRWQEYQNLKSEFEK